MVPARARDAPGEAEPPSEDGAPPGEGGVPQAARLPLWRRALPPVIALLLVAYVLGRLDLPTFLRHLAGVSYLGFFGFATAFLLALLSADALGTTLIYRSQVAAVSFRDLWIVRGASYLPSIVNHHLGQAWITYFLARVYRAPLGRVAGATLLVYVSWAGWLTAAMLLGGYPPGWLAAALLFGVAYLAVIRARPAPLARFPWLAPLFEAGVRGHLVALAARFPHFAVLFLGTWIPFWFFGVRIPLRDALAKIPVLMVAATLPITPQGFGTRDFVAVTLFERYVDAPTHEQRLAAIAAATTSFGVATVLVELVLGLLLLRRALPLLGRGRDLPGAAAGGARV